MKRVFRLFIERPTAT